MGEIDLVPVFGKDFNNFFPVVLIILCLFHAFDLYAKILNAIGLNRFVFAENYNSDNIEEGRAIANKRNFSNILAS